MKQRQRREKIYRIREWQKQRKRDKRLALEKNSANSGENLADYYGARMLEAKQEGIIFGFLSVVFGIVLFFVLNVGTLLLFLGTVGMTLWLIAEYLAYQNSQASLEVELRKCSKLPDFATE